jgi:DNA-binding HxlR family transcriptional regulator
VQNLQELFGNRNHGGARLKKHFGCPVQATINTVSGKWKVLAIWHLGFGAKRFAELRKLLPGVSAKVLTAQLRGLERDGVVQREFKRASPPQTSYRLTKAGDDLLDPMTELCHWGTRYLGVPPNLPRYPKGSKK